MPSVIAFPRGGPHLSLPGNATAPVESAQERLSHDREIEEEYRHRVRVNLFATVAIVALITIGVWIANAMIKMQEGQGCYASGQRTCSLL